MKIIILVIGCVFILDQAIAQSQPCNDAAIMNVKGKWTVSGNNIVNPDKTYPNSQYSQLYSRLDKIAALIQQAYSQPVGMEAKWYRSIRGSAMVNNGPVPYQFNSLYPAWYCNQNLHKLMLGDETGTWAYVFVNRFDWFLNDQYDQAAIKIEGVQAWLLPKRIGEWKGMPLYEPSGSGNVNKAVLITRTDHLPYKPVSRLQFLQSLKEKIEADKKIQIDISNKMPVKSDAEEEEVKQKRLAIYLKSDPIHEASFLKNYKTSKQLKEESLQQWEKYFGDRLNPVEDALKNGHNDELQQPAIVTNDYTSIFKGFTTEERGGRMVVLVNTGYFNMQLPRYAAQFMVLYWSWDKNAPAQRFKSQFEENFPIDKLREMVDK
jgi:hypothetical protein